MNTWINHVRKSGLTYFDSFIKTLTNHMKEITNYFNGRMNSGFVEGANNKIKVLKRRCYGLSNSAHLFQRIKLDFEGYAMFSNKNSTLCC
ncbi:transposase [Achromatium sp. WMS3]|nr:transposase [Achromatium sp. WMS3]